MEEYYISEDLFLRDNELFKISDNKEIKVNRKNCFKYLNDYGWEKINKQWREKLENNYTCLLECGSDGDCLFHVLAEALNFDLIYKNKIPEFDISSLRILCSKQINKNNFEIILESYKAEYECGEFFGECDPNSIQNKEELQIEIMKLGNNFWGDHILMQLLSSKLEINSNAKLSTSD